MLRFYSGQRRSLLEVNHWKIYWILLCYVIIMMQCCASVSCAMLFCFVLHCILPYHIVSIFCKLCCSILSHNSPLLSVTPHLSFPYYSTLCYPYEPGPNLTRYILPHLAPPNVSFCYIILAHPWLTHPVILIVLLLNIVFRCSCC